MARCEILEHVDAHFERRLPIDQVHALFEHLPDCLQCRKRYEGHLLIEILDPQARGPKVRMRTGLPRVAPRRLGIAMAAPLFAAAAALLVINLARQGDGFFPRGHAVEAAAQSRVEIYRVVPGASPRIVEDTMQRSDDLAFAYLNPTGKARLLIFAVDEHRHVYWYYPAWADQDEAPKAVPIHKSNELVELSEAVVQPIDGSQLTIFAVFTDEPLDVRDVEARVAASRSVVQNLGLHDAIEMARTLEVR
jgi:hypothetical protein